MNLTKRHLLLALAAIGAAPALAQNADPIAGGRDIGRAWIAANPSADLAALRASLMPRGFSAETAQTLRTRVADDFRNARVFVHNGWRLSQTEAQLFALLAA